MTTLALDVGGSTIRGVVSDDSGESLTAEVIQTGDRDPRLRTLRAVAERLSAAARKAGVPLRAIGVGMPEYVDPSGDLTSSLVLDWTEQPRSLLADLAPIVAVESDVRCAAMAEATESDNDVVVLSVGTGIAHAAIHAGRLISGARGEAIGLGQLPVPALGGETPLRVEEVASGAGLTRRFHDRTGRSVPEGARGVVDLATRGDSVANALIEQAGHALAYAAWVAVQAFDPHRIVLTGGLGSASGPLHDVLIARYAEMTSDRPGAPPIRISRFGDRSGIIGAQIVARRTLRDQELR